MFGLNIHHLAMANSVRWYGHVLRIENDHVLRMALNIDVEGERKKGRLKRKQERHVDCCWVRCIWPPSLVRTLPGFIRWSLSVRHTEV